MLLLGFILLNLYSWSSFTLLVSAGEADHQRRYLYAGGRYEKNDDGAHVYKDQMYVEHLIPSGGVRKDFPLLFVHGQGQTGAVSDKLTHVGA